MNPHPAWLHLLAAPWAAADTLPSGPGLASCYPGDRGIEGAPHVVQVEDFEQLDIAALASEGEFYTYWCEMCGSPPRGQTWGNSFIRDPSLAVRKGRWICSEQMMSMNDVGERNGEQTLWIDGNLIAHLGKRFPKGRWTFDEFEPGRGGAGARWNARENAREHFELTAGGTPFDGFQWRTVPGLNVNFIWLIHLHREARRPSHPCLLRRRGGGDEIHRSAGVGARRMKLDPLIDVTPYITP